MASSDNFVLLDLLPGQHGENIICQTRLACLETCGPYETLSYVWMEAAGWRIIQVSGQEVEVTCNLHAALQRLRHEKKTRTLWIDQLCIDQWDIEKKAKQVDMMRVIYRQCRLCLIWLGEIPQGKGFTFTALDVGNVFEFIQQSAKPGDDLDGQQSLVEKLSSPDARDRARNAFTAFGIKGNPWWSRIWTVQESVLPKAAQVVWGSQMVEWSDTQQASRNYCQRLWSLPLVLIKIFRDLLDYVISPVRGLEIAQGGDNTLNLLERWRYRGATDPRDKIFALLGLFFQPPFPSVQHCDYTLSAQALHTRVTVDLLGIEGGLRPFVGIRDSINEHLPTWVTDFGKLPNVDTSERWWNHVHRYARSNADAYTTFTYKYLADIQALELAGIRISGVEEVAQESLSAYEHTEVDNQDLLRVIRSWHDDTNWNAAKFGANYPNGNTRANAFGATLIGDFLMDEFPTRGAIRIEQYLVFQYATRGVEIDSRALSRSLTTFVINQKFFVTTDGYFGMGPKMMIPGDEVWILFGGRVPFILRRKNTHGEADNGYTLVGHAFLYGIMNGEATQSRWPEKRLIRLY
ncbi:hypothetical protein PFICI_12280 [Pestalotiopsis fici W106-1]|uniref:Heterokaryon incompatibility domain-containing protein n=1 Tax=Pestalotiopsis fici (strain W106-1 / CGMCC3.15140) TaxID=1229662 RepID=W3WR92_PESFW|nr:uncharacterized protein PFICI_12280 [Pestalotiopsis fici W106-1]ETS75336.1 hypothetical protein PFICI_12280 [Pestalotiopsis fici W106-1]